MEQLRISCILPVCNGERYLAETLDSILAQTFQPHEIIVIDDGSTDGTAAVTAGYGRRVRTIRQENAGPAAARNHGLGVAQGELIAFQDADDVWHPEKLARQRARFVARPDLEMCSCHVQNFWIPELEEEAANFSSHILSQPLPGQERPQALLVRRTLFDTVGLFNAALRLASDTDWFLRAIELGVVVETLPDVLVYRRWHKTNISRGSRPTLAQVVKASLDRRRQRSGGAPEALVLPPAEPPRRD